MSGLVWAKAKAKPQTSITPEEQMRLDYYLYAALDASERKEHAQAYFLLELCYSIDPTNPTVCSLLGSYKQNLYGKENALPLLRQAYEGSPHDYWYQYVVTAYDAGQRSVAMNVLKQMEKLEPKNIDLLELHEHIFRHEKKYKQALTIRDKIDKLTGEPTLSSVVTRYEIYCDMNQESNGLQVLDDYLAKNPDEGRLRALRNDRAISEASKTNDTVKAIQLLKIQMRSPDVALTNKLKLLEREREWLNIGLKEHKVWLQELREQYPYEPEIYKALMNNEEQSGNISAAIELGRTMLAMNPTDSKLREKIANLMRDDDSIPLKQVGLFIDESYSILPDAPKWGYFKALRCLQHEDYDSAVIVLERAVQHAEEPMVRMQILIMYGDVLGQTKQYEKAFAVYDEVLQVVPDHPSVLNNYAWSLAISGGDLKKAEKMSQRTIQKEANNPTYLDTYAWILHLQGQNTLAMFYIRKALEHSDQPDATIMEHFQAIQQALEK